MLASWRQVRSQPQQVPRIVFLSRAPLLDRGSDGFCGFSQWFVVLDRGISDPIDFMFLRFRGLVPLMVSDRWFRGSAGSVRSVITIAPCFHGLYGFRRGPLIPVGFHGSVDSLDFAAPWVPLASWIPWFRGLRVLHVEIPYA